MGTWKSINSWYAVRPNSNCTIVAVLNLPEQQIHHLNFKLIDSQQKYVPCFCLSLNFLKNSI